MRNIELIKVCSDLGAGTQGACFGAEALQMMAQQDTGNPFQTLSLKTCHVPPSNGYHSQYAKNIEAIYKICRSIAQEVSSSLLSNRFPILISGDHSCAAGTIAGIKMAKSNSRLGVVWIDAHADLHSPYTTPSGNMHGMPLAASTNNDNTATTKQQIDDQTKAYWNKLKNLGGISPKILPQDIVYVSLRDFEEEEALLIKNHKIKVISTESVRRCGITDVANTILKQLEYCTDIYVSFDTDCLDASVSRGTGLPVDGGLMPHEARQLITLLAGNPKICSLEFTELNPFFDVNSETSAIIYQLFKAGIQSFRAKTFGEKIACQRS
jgi:arginase